MARVPSGTIITTRDKKPKVEVEDTTISVVCDVSRDILVNGDCNKIKPFASDCIEIQSDIKIKVVNIDCGIKMVHQNEVKLEMLESGSFKKRKMNVNHSEFKDTSASSPMSNSLPASYLSLTNIKNYNISDNSEDFTNVSNVPATTKIVSNISVSNRLNSPVSEMVRVPSGTIITIRDKKPKVEVEDKTISVVCDVSRDILVNGDCNKIKPFASDCIEIQSDIKIKVVNIDCGIKMVHQNEVKLEMLESGSFKKRKMNVNHSEFKDTSASSPMSNSLPASYLSLTNIKNYNISDNSEDFTNVSNVPATTKIVSNISVSNRLNSPVSEMVRVPSGTIITIRDKKPKVEVEDKTISMADENTVDEVDTSNVPISRVCDSCQRDIVDGDDMNEIIFHCATCKTELHKQRKELFVGKVIQLYGSCLFCLNMFRNNLTYEKHDCTLEGVFVCDGCSRIYLKKESIADHVQKCKTLISKMNNFESKTNEVKESISEVNFQNCEGTSGSNESRNDQIMPKSGSSMIARSKLPKTGKQFSCSICGKCFSYKHHLILHLRVHHTGEKPFNCKYCNKKFTSSFNVKVHLRTHTGDKPYECKYCNKKFTQLSHLSHHLRTHTGEKPFVCKNCNKKFTLLYHLNRHLRTHTGEKPFVCKNCNKKFTQSSNLNRHLRTHTGEKPFVCKNCNKKFTELSHLNQHLRTYTGEKPFVCKNCNTKFTRPDTLNRHLRTHTGEKPFVCKNCNKKFTRSDMLNRHLRTHTGGKPFVCKNCNKKFTQLSHLNQHVRTHTEEHIHETGSNN